MHCQLDVPLGCCELGWALPNAAGTLFHAIAFFAAYERRSIAWARMDFDKHDKDLVQPKACSLLPCQRCRTIEGGCLLAFVMVLWSGRLMTSPRTDTMRRKGASKRGNGTRPKKFAPVSAVSGYLNLPRLLRLSSAERSRQVTQLLSLPSDMSALRYPWDVPCVPASRKPLEDPHCVLKQ